MSLDWFQGQFSPENPIFHGKHAPVSGLDFPFPMLKRTNLHRKWRRWWSRALQTSAAPWRSASPPADEDQICVSYGDSMTINGDYIWRLMEIIYMEYFIYTYYRYQKVIYRDKKLRSWDRWCDHGISDQRVNMGLDFQGKSPSFDSWMMTGGTPLWLRRPAYTCNR